MTRPHLHTISLLLCCLAFWLGVTLSVCAGTTDLFVSFKLMPEANATPPSPASPTKKPGMAVWGNTLYIYTADTLTVRGDLHLTDANILGRGAVLLKSETSSEIKSHHSSLPNLPASRLVVRAGGYYARLQQQPTSPHRTPVANNGNASFLPIASILPSVGWKRIRFPPPRIGRAARYRKKIRRDGKPT